MSASFETIQKKISEEMVFSNHGIFFEGLKNLHFVSQVLSEEDLIKRSIGIYALIKKNPDYMDFLKKLTSEKDMMVEFRPHSTISASGEYTPIYTIVELNAISLSADIKDIQELFDIFVFETCNASNVGLHPRKIGLLSDFDTFFKTYRDAEHYADSIEEIERETVILYSKFMKTGIEKYNWPGSIRKHDLSGKNLKEYLESAPVKIPQDVHHGYSHHGVYKKTFYDNALRLLNSKIASLKLKIGFYSLICLGHKPFCLSLKQELKKLEERRHQYQEELSELKEEAEAFLLVTNKARMDQEFQSLVLPKSEVRDSLKSAYFEYAKKTAELEERYKQREYVFGQYRKWMQEHKKFKSLINKYRQELQAQVTQINHISNTAATVSTSVDNTKKSL